MPVMAASGETTVTGTVPLVTYEVSASDIGYYSATICWKTNGNATSQVFYDTEFHKDIADYAYHTDEDTTLVSEHSIRLTGLSSDTRYHFRVRSAILEADFIAVSSDYTFTTRTPAPPAPAPPRYYLGINLFGEIFRWRLASSGRLLETVDITSEDGKVNIFIAKGTYCLDEKGDRLRKLIVTVQEEAPEIPEGYFLLSNTYDLSPDGATFDPYLRLTLAYEEEDIPEEIREENLYIAYYSHEWLPLDSIVDAEENKVSADVTHFTIFAIMAKAPPPPLPAEFVVSNLVSVLPRLNLVKR